jgi:hypothetical protein
MDRLQILNSALTKLGQEEQLDDPDADTRAARALNANWDAMRDIVLRAHVWNFAVDPAGLTLTADGAWKPASLADHANRYLLPPDFLRLDLQRIRPRSLRLELRVGGRWLYSPSSGALHISYVSKVSEVGRWDALFAEAFSARLAAQCCKRITGDLAHRSALMSEYAVHLAEAKAVDGRENPPEEIEETDWSTARHDAGAGFRAV